jgi:hypothetical protein
MAYDALDFVNEAAEVSVDMNEAQAGGGGTFEVPAAGLARARLVTYIEYGVHEDTVKGETKKKDMVLLEFELSGPKHPVRETDGKPHIVQVRMPKSLNEKANYFKLFKKLNYDGKAKIFAQLLGKAFLVTVVLKEEGEGDKKRTWVNLRDMNGFTIRPPFVDDPETGEPKAVPVDPPKTALKVFLWDAPKGLKDMWDGLYIDGIYEAKTDDAGKVTREAKSKNWIQNLIRSAINFKDSPIGQIVGAGGEPDLPDAEKTERSEANIEASKDAKAGASADPLAGL